VNKLSQVTKEMLTDDKKFHIHKEPEIHSQIFRQADIEFALEAGRRHNHSEITLRD
jgi:hypothetical protein